MESEWAMVEEMHGGDKTKENKAWHVTPRQTHPLTAQGGQSQDGQRCDPQPPCGDLVGRKRGGPAGQHRAGGEEENGHAYVEQSATFLAHGSPSETITRYVRSLVATSRQRGGSGIDLHHLRADLFAVHSYPHVVIETTLRLLVIVKR